MSNVTVQVHTSGEAGLFVNSYMIETLSGVIAIDTPFSVSESRALRAQLEGIGKPLLAVLLTHAHPDHVNGTTILRGDAEVPVLATPGVDATLREIDGPKRAFWTPIYGEDYPPVTTFPNRLVHDGDTVTFDGVNIRVLDMGAGEGAFETVFVLEEQNIAFIGDVAYNHFHVWLAEGRSSAWLKQLDKLRPKLEGLRVLYPGHGKPGDASILAWQRAYLEAFRAAVQDLADGQATLDEAGKTELTRRMEAFDPQAPLSSWVAYGADPVAAELADDDR